MRGSFSPSVEVVDLNAAERGLMLSEGFDDVLGWCREGGRNGGESKRVCMHTCWFKLRALCITGKYSTTELFLYPYTLEISLLRFIYVYECFPCLYMCTPHTCAAHRGQKRSSEPLKLELPWGCWKQPESSAGAASALNYFVSLLYFRF